MLMSHRSYCFTLNNYVDADLSRLVALGRSNSVSYLVYGKEIGKSGTQHLQGLVCYKRGRKCKLAKDDIGKRSHIEPMRGTHQEASDYCKKDGDFAEYGTIPSPGKRTDIEDLVQRARDSKSITTIADEYPNLFIRHASGIRSWFHTASILQPRSWKSEVTVLFGHPGTGKSKLAWESASAIGRVYYKPNGEWWDGYDSHESVIIDDFYGNYPFHDLLKCLDRYPHKVPIKGGFAEFVPKYIWITSNRAASTWYNWEKVGEASALLRRIDTYTYFDKHGRRSSGTDYEIAQGLQPPVDI